MITRRFPSSLLLAFLFAGCNNQPSGLSKAESSPTPTPVAIATSSASAVASSDAKSPFSVVTSQLDAGGGFYFYWEIDKILAQLTKGITSARDATVLSGNLTPEQSAKVKEKFDIALQLLTSSGLTGLQAVGAGSKQESSGSYLTKSVVFAPAQTGFLWSTFWKQSHPFDAIDFVPANTEAFGFFDVDLSALWSSLEKDLTASQIPDAVQFAQELPKQFQGKYAVPLSYILGSLGDQAGYIVTLDPSSKVKIPISGIEVEMTEPAIAILWKVRDEKVFNMLEGLELMLMLDVENLDEPDLRLRIFKPTDIATFYPFLPRLFRPFLSYVSDLKNLAYHPTLARFADYLVFASNPKLVRALRDTKTGKVPGLKTRTDFATISKGLLDRGNSVQYVSKQFQSAYHGLLEEQLASSAPDTLSPVAAAGLKSLAAFMRDYESYSVLTRTDTGLISLVRASKNPADILGQLATLPRYSRIWRSLNHSLLEPWK